MANERRQKIIEIITNNFVAVAAIFVVLMLIIPWPGRAIDIFMALNLALSISILLIVMYTPKSSNFTSFPRVILLVTLFGLGINVASTKNILWFGKDPKYMSLMVNAFSSFVIGKDDSILGLVVGMVVFIILIVIQVLVITKGATRVSEVAARFALDSMAQKNFAVDAELNTGAITEEQAQQKRAEIRRESDFYSAMDGSSKFVSGNVTAGIFITVVNLVAGLIIGVLVRKEQFGAAAANYCRMTIGDGLISQIPSLLLSFATGLIVTGSNSDEVLSKQLQHDFTVSGRVYIIGGAVLAIIGILPGMPHIILLGLGGLAIYAGIMMTRAEKASFAKKLEEEQNAQGKDKKGKSPGEVSPVVPLDPLSLELGYVLISLVDEEKGAELLERITPMRK